MHIHQSDSDSSKDSMEHPPLFKCEKEKQEQAFQKKGATHAAFESEYVQQRKKRNKECPTKKQKQDKSGEMSQKKQQKTEDKHPTKAEGLMHMCVLLVTIILLLGIIAGQRELKVKSDLRIMLVGKTGAGKSASGNTILGEKVFEEKLSSESVTKKCQKHQKKVEGRSISVIDTPGIFETKISEKQLKDEIKKCVEISVPGPHAFLLVIRLDMRFTDKEKKTMKWIQENFGEKAADYSIILFTRGDQLDIPIEEFLAENREIEELVRQCKSRYHVFNNKDKNPSQVYELLDKIETMVKENGGEHYTNKMYKEVQERQRKEEERQRLEEEEKMKMEALERQRLEEDLKKKMEALEKREEEIKMKSEALERQRSEEFQIKMKIEALERMKEEFKMKMEDLERQRKEEERRRLEEEGKKKMEALERQKQEDERKRLEEEFKRKMEDLERQKDENTYTILKVVSEEEVVLRFVSNMFS